MFFPWLVPFFPGMIYKMKNNIKGILKYLSEEFIKEHQRDFDTENPRDFLDLYLIEMSKEVNEENKEALKTFNIEQLQHVIGDLFAGGTETGSTTIKWALLFMIHHPKIQEKVQAEIDEVIGKERLPTMEDKRLLPFTTATLQEVERLASVAPFGVPRSNDKPAEFAGYKFPENSIFLFNLYNVHRDPTYWKNPLDFDPNRFIDKDGKDFRPPYLMPFGSGKRGCVGESMAKMEIFLLFVTLLQRFTFEQDGNDLPILDTGPRSLDRSPSAFTKSKRSLKAECVLDFKLLCSCQCNRKARKFQDAFIAIAAILSILTHLLTSSGPGRKMPPGPIGIPIFGNMPWFIFTDPNKYLVKLYKNLVFNKSYEYDDPKFLNNIERLDENFSAAGKVQIIMFFPWLVPFFSGMINTMKKNIKVVLKYQSEEFIKEHQKDFDSENPRDFLDLYLIEMSKEVNEENKDALKTFNIEQLQYVISDLFAAGTETGSTTISWALLFMIHHPKIQEKVQAEIDEVIGKERLPTMEDKRLLPFTTATLQEIERLGSVLPATIPRSNDKPVEFKGYKFPENSVFLFDLYSVHRDPTYWKNPLDFDPNRFIDKDGKVFRPPYLMPFGSGKRVCVGESMAKMEIFLIFVTLLQRFTFENDGKDLPNLDTRARSLARSPSAYKVCAISRN
ncbi:Cytochrome P450 2C8 [Nymphon striatum]|nr:Cytochrome P450 2C8 [Nymphon striatum]